MKWWPSPCRPGDMIRIRLGSIWHYGIFVSESEVIQFGPPPVAGLRADGEVTVCATDMDTFCCGGIAETAELDKAEAKTRIPPEETVRLARSRMGEGGYNLIHNNCEHFAHQCVFGIRRSNQEEDARRRWNNRPICDVYVAVIPENLTVEPVSCRSRQKELEKTTHPDLKKQRFLVWKVLEYALNRSFGKDAAAMEFRKDRHGRWSCAEVQFSLSHTRNAVAVAVSNGPVGVDVEQIPEFLEKFTPDSKVFRAAAGKITAGGETCPDPETLLDLWTRKESLFKQQGGSRFVPRKLAAAGAPVQTSRIDLPEPVYLAVSGEKADRARYYLYENGSARLMGADLRKNGMER